MMLTKKTQVTTEHGTPCPLKEYSLVVPKIYAMMFVVSITYCCHLRVKHSTDLRMTISTKMICDSNKYHQCQSLCII